MLNLATLSSPMSPLDFFALLVRQDTDFPLLEASISVAQDEDETLNIQQVLSTVDELINELQRKIPQDASALQRLQILNRFFYIDKGFAGNVNDYYAPSNSHLHQVLRTRLGLPITLAILWLELARNAGINAAGINFPGHFLVTARLPQGRVVLDPLNARSLDRHELATQLEPYIQSKLFNQDAEALLKLYLQTAQPRDVLARLLRNLKEIYRSCTDWDRLVCVQNRLIILLPESWNEYRERGLALAKLGQKQAAAHDLNVYLNRSASAEDHEMVRITLAQLM